MKKIILSLAILTVAASCSNKVKCYECDMKMDGVWKDAGCYTKDEWKSIQIANSTGNGTGYLDKSQYCRVRE